MALLIIIIINSCPGHTWWFEPTNGWFAGPVPVYNSVSLYYVERCVVHLFIDLGLCVLYCLAMTSQK